MLNEHTLDQLRSLRLDGMLRAIEEQATSAPAPTNSASTTGCRCWCSARSPGATTATWLGCSRPPRLKVSGTCIEDINWRASRGLDRGVVTALAGGDWLRHARNVLLTGATGSGKTWLACALAHQAARGGFSVLYVRAARLFDELQVAHGDGSFARRLAQLARLDQIWTSADNGRQQSDREIKGATVRDG